MNRLHALLPLLALTACSSPPRDRRPGLGFRGRVLHRSAVRYRHRHTKGTHPMTPAEIARETCETCRFLEPDNRPDYTGCGTCRRFPPIVVETVAFDGSGGNHFSQHRPWMNKGEWCGEYQEQNND